MSQSSFVARDDASLSKPALAAGRPESAVDMWLGQQLRQLRKQHGRSLADVAQACGMSVGLLSQIERGLSSASVKMLHQLAREFGVSVNTLLRNAEHTEVEDGGRVARAGTHRYIDLREKGAIQDIMRTVVVKPGEPFILQPREFALAITEESLELDDDVLARLEGRSSLGRIGIIVHGTAGLFDPGWRGKATLELSNLGRMPVALYPGMRICSFTFEQLSSPVSTPYYKKAGNKYAGQTQPLASKLTAEVSKL